MIALDTNVLIYACDRSNPERQQTASQLIERTTDGVLLWPRSLAVIQVDTKTLNRVRVFALIGRPVRFASNACSC